MRILYRRFSGSIGVTSGEKGSRGLWLEKRVALWCYLQQRGHQVIPASPPTAASSKMWEWDPSTDLRHLIPQADYLFIEFSGTNFQFYGDSIQKTVALAQSWPGPIAFLCDDPDLLLPMKFFRSDEAKWERWIGLFNACLTEEQQRGTGYYAQVPAAMRIVDAPFGSLLHSEQPGITPVGNPFLVYIGRPQGRKQDLDVVLRSGVPLKVYGNPKEWDGLNLSTRHPTVFPSPSQPQRKQFYRDSLACLALADNKHKALGWRTGRAYHAIAAGCPVLHPDTHLGLRFTSYRNAEELKAILGEWSNPAKRANEWIDQVEKLVLERAIMDSTMEALGL